MVCKKARHRAEQELSMERTIRFDEEIMDKLKERARKNSRSVQKEIEHILKETLKNDRRLV